MVDILLAIVDALVYVCSVYLYKATGKINVYYMAFQKGIANAISYANLVLCPIFMFVMLNRFEFADNDICTFLSGVAVVAMSVITSILPFEGPLYHGDHVFSIMQFIDDYRTISGCKKLPVLSYYMFKKMRTIAPEMFEESTSYDGRLWEMLYHQKCYRMTFIGYIRAMLFIARKKESGINFPKRENERELYEIMQMDIEAKRKQIEKIVDEATDSIKSASKNIDTICKRMSK